MNDRPLMHRVAALLRRMPWLVTLAYYLWRWRQAKFSAGVVGVIFDDQGRILLVHHVFHPHNPWGLPGGWVGRNEAPDATLVRELREELDMQVEVGPLVAMQLTGRSHMDYAYLCKPQNAIGAISRELLGYKWQDVMELPRLYDFHYRAVRQALDMMQAMTD